MIEPTPLNDWLDELMLHDLVADDVHVTFYFIFFYLFTYKFFLFLPPHVCVYMCWFKLTLFGLYSTIIVCLVGVNDHWVTFIHVYKFFFFLSTKFNCIHAVPVLVIHIFHPSTFYLSLTSARQIITWLIEIQRKKKIW